MCNFFYKHQYESKYKFTSSLNSFSTLMSAFLLHQQGFVNKFAEKSTILVTTFIEILQMVQEAPHQTLDNENFK